VPGIRQLTEVLIEGGWVSPEVIQEAERQGFEGSRLAEYLVEAGHLTEEELAQARARQYSLPYVDLASVEADISLLKRLAGVPARCRNPVISPC
jgi:hypothetical protein